MPQKSYECKAVAQERPYVSRPSRTQQLLDPKLLPKLTSDIPQDLLRKKGIADEQLARVERERGRKRDREDNEAGLLARPNRSRSASAGSSASVATISTSDSRSSQALKGNNQPNIRVDGRMTNSERKRRRSLSSDGSYPSDSGSSHGEHFSSLRNTRRKIGEHSPLARGRRRSRSDSRSFSSYSSKSTSLDRPQNRQDELNRKGGLGPERISGQRLDKYRASYKRSPRDRPRYRSVSIEDSNRRGGKESRRSFNGETSQEVVQSHGKEEEGYRKSQNPSTGRRQRDRSLSRDGHSDRRYSDAGDRYGTSNRYSQRAPPSGTRDSRVPPRERSMSPFSKRLALTQAMNSGR